MLVLYADHDAVGLVEVVDRVAFFETRVVGDREADVRCRGGSVALEVVPTGTVDLTTMVPVTRRIFLESAGDVVRGAMTYFRSACPVASLGVPTQMNDFRVAVGPTGSVVKWRRPFLMLRSKQLIEPGS